MFKLQFYLTLWSVAHAAYYSRMATVNRIRGPSVFRPGVSMAGMQRQPYPPRFVQAASHRAPYVVYRNPPHRYAMKHYGPATRNAFPPGWKTTARLPPATPVTPEYDFIRAASAPTRLHADGTGAIHTIPAPNLSLSEKPIVVIEEIVSSKPAVSEAPQATYEVTEKYADALYQMTPKIELPVGFSKATSLTSPEIQSLIRNGAALQFASEYGLNAIALPHQIQPQQFTVQGFSSLPNQHDLLHAGAESIVIQPQALYQPDPLFLQKLQNQLMQKYPAIEFIPYPADIAQAPVNSQPQTHGQSQLFLLQNEEITKQTPTAFEPSKNVVPRETQESSVVTLVPQGFVLNNVTENLVEVTSASAPQNVTLELLSDETHPGTTTVKYVIERKEQDQSTTPLYYAQVGQSVGNIVANGFYSALNDVRAAAALVQVEKPTEPNTHVENLTTTTINPDMKNYFVQNSENSQNVTELKPILGVPFTKKTDSVNIAYTLVRADDKDPKVTQEGAIYAGQLVEATISEDHDFNKEKESLMSRRAPLRLFAIEKKDTTTTTTTTNPPPKMSVVKKIPPKSKLTFDDKTGEPVLRIYASYIDSPLQKELLASKLSNIKQLKEAMTRKDTVDNWKAATVKAMEKTQGPDANQVTQFGIKLRSRSDDYIPLFEEYEE